jgi:peptidoglycan/xylan/chitin deacetylase (PgdA/CDA1 family)
MTGWPVREVLLIPALDWRDYLVCRGRTPAPDEYHAPRLAATFSYLLEQLVAYGDAATVGFFGRTAYEQPELVRRAVGAGCEVAAMTYEAVDTRRLSADRLAEQVHDAVAAVRELGLPAPTSFMPPLPANQELSPAFIDALRARGIRRTLGCVGRGMPAMPLAVYRSWPLTGMLARLAPVWFLRDTLRRQPGAALCVSTIDIDPGAPHAGLGRGRLLRKLPKLLAGGFVAAEPATQ